MEPTAASYFKNLPPGFQVPGLPHSPGTRRVPAGALLDACGCLLRAIRSSIPSTPTSSVNDGRATARDVLELAEIMNSRVRERFGIELEEEVMFLGPRPKLDGAGG